MILRAVIVAAAAIIASPAQGQLFKCVGKDGKTAYQAEPCPASDQEQRVRGPTPPASQSKQGQYKQGWNEAGLKFMADQCMDNAMGKSQQYYDAHSQAMPRQLLADVTNHCNCVASHLAASWTLEEYRRNTREINIQMRQDTERCKPEGVHAEVVRKYQEWKGQQAK